MPIMSSAAAAASEDAADDPTESWDPEMSLTPTWYSELRSKQSSQQSVKNPGEMLQRASSRKTTKIKLTVSTDLVSTQI